jgi:hypothetical protein
VRQHLRLFLTNTAALLAFCKMSFRVQSLCWSSVALLLCLTIALSNAASSVDTILGLKYDSSTTSLVKGLSDHTANFDPETNLIFIAGGCDAADGNVYKDFALQCLDCSDEFYSFDPSNQELKRLPNMPVERYRHAAVLVNKHLWVLGGRDKGDAVPETVDVSFL